MGDVNLDLGRQERICLLVATHTRPRGKHFCKENWMVVDDIEKG